MCKVYKKRKDLFNEKFLLFVYWYKKEKILEWLIESKNNII